MKDTIYCIILYIVFSIGYIFKAQEIPMELQNKQIVLLGEQTHGDGATFDAKVEIIKKLHRDFGFTIVLFESGLYDNFKANELYRSKKETISVYEQSVFPIWTNTQAFQNLLDYIEQYPEIKLLGFDCQESGLFQDYYFEDLKKLFQRNNVFISEKDYEILQETMAYDFPEYYLEKSKLQELFSLYDKVQSYLEQIPLSDDFSKIIRQTFKSVRAKVEYEIEYLKEKKIIVQNPRDDQMAKNFAFIAQLYPNEKCIGWGASFHFAKNTNTLEVTEITTSYLKNYLEQLKEITGHVEETYDKGLKQLKELKKAIPMGQILKEKFKDKLYTLAFTSYEGNYLGAHQMVFPQLIPPKNSFEVRMHQQGNNEKWIDLNRSNFSENYYSSLLGYIPLFSDWKLNFDGIYYIPQMYPPELKNYSETYTEESKHNTFKITGKIVDKELQTPIAFADVYYAHNNKSLTTNEEGVFSIANSDNLEEYLVFSAFSYQSDSIQLKNIKTENLEISLQYKEVNELSELVVESKNELSSKEILKRAKENLEQNYTHMPFNQNFYFGIRNYKSDSLRSFGDAYIKTYLDKGNTGSAHSYHHLFGEILQFKSDSKKRNKHEWVGVESLWTTMNRGIIINKANVLYRTSAYDLKKARIVNYEGKEVYLIDFMNHSPNAYNTGYGNPAPVQSKGKIYIDKPTYAILRYEHCVERKMSTKKKINYSFKRYHHIIQTFKEIESKYYQNLLRYSDKTEYYSQNEKQEYLGSTYVIKTLMSTDVETQNVEVLQRPIQELKMKNSHNYSQQFWEKHNFYLEEVIAPFVNCKELY